MGKEGVVIVIQAQNGIQKILIGDEAVVFRIILRLQHVVFVLGFLHMIGKYLLGESILIFIVRVKVIRLISPRRQISATEIFSNGISCKMAVSVALILRFVLVIRLSSNRFAPPFRRIVRQDYPNTWCSVYLF